MGSENLWSLEYSLQTPCRTYTLRLSFMFYLNRYYYYYSLFYYYYFLVIYILSCFSLGVVKSVT